MRALLSIDELREKYKDILNNSDLKQISEWTETNTDERTDEAVLLDKIFKNIDSYSKKIEEAITIKGNAENAI